MNIKNMCHVRTVESPAKKQQLGEACAVFVLLLLASSEAGTCVELEENNVTVFHGVVLPLLPVFSGSLSSSLRALLLEVGIIHHLGHNETFLEVCVNSSGCLRRLGALLDGPSLDLVGSGSEKVLEVKRLVALGDHLFQSAVTHQASGMANN